jgi:excisionase family DNA binding protein
MDRSDQKNMTGGKSRQSVAVAARESIPRTPIEKLAFTIREAAQLSSLGQTSIYKAIREGRLRSRKYGTRTIIARTDLLSFLDNLPEENKGSDQGSNSQCPTGV